MKSAVAFFVFNRPEPTARVFAEIRAARPPKLFVICDGPRSHRAGEAEKVAAVRKLIDDGIDWPCEVFRNYSEQNLGCRNRVSSGLAWTFSHVEEAIILEDDCLPSPDFFTFCDAMLERYRDDERIVHIAGCNFTAPYHRPHASYRFTYHSWIWGWATWRRVWQKYDFEMKTWDERLHVTRASFASAWEAHYWLPTFEESRADLVKANTWGVPWMYPCRSLGGLSILPAKNLIENIGFGADSTHTGDEMKRVRVPAQ